MSNFLKRKLFVNYVKCYSQDIMPQVIAHSRTPENESHWAGLWASRSSRQQKVHNVQNPQIGPAYATRTLRRACTHSTYVWHVKQRPTGLIVMFLMLNFGKKDWDNRLHSGWNAPRCPQRRCLSESACCPSAAHVVTGASLARCRVPR